MNWLYTNIQHGPRLDLGLSPNEYCVLDLYYQSQSSPLYGIDGWSENSYQQVSDFMGFSKGAVHKMVDRFVESGLMEVNPANPKQKRTTESWFLAAYQRVQKVNDRKSAVQKVNAAVHLVNANRSKSERHIEERKDKRELKGKVGRYAGEQFLSIDELNDLDSQSATDQKEKPTTLAEAEQQARERFPKLQAHRGQAAPIVDEPVTEPARTPEDATEQIMAEIKTEAGQRKLKFALGTAGISDTKELNLFAAVYRCAQHQEELRGTVPKNLWGKLPGYIKNQKTRDARAAQTQSDYANSTKSNGPYRQATTRPIVSREDSLSVAEELLQEHLAGANSVGW